MRSRKRIAAVAGMLAVLTAVGMLAFNPFAKADPPGVSIDGDNGRKVQRFYHPDRDDCWVEVAVDTQRGYLESDVDARYVSGVTRVTRGPCAVRVQVDDIRLGIVNRVVNDYFPSQSSSARDNTPTGLGSTEPDCERATSPTVTDLFDDKNIPLDGCQFWPNRLNSDADYPGNATVVRGYSDWEPLAGSDCGPLRTVGIRGFIATRWDDNLYSLFTLRTDNVSTDC